MMTSKQSFVVTIYTDGMDYPRDMHSIANALRSAVPDVVRPFVREVQPAQASWTAKSTQTGTKKAAKARRASARKVSP